MERRFGTHFDDVRVHTDAAATDAAATLGAKAYTVGSDIVLGASAPRPEEPTGQNLLAHELAHVVQQRGGGDAPALDPRAAHEQEADEAAKAFAAGSSHLSIRHPTAPGVARLPEFLEDYFDFRARLRARMTSIVAGGIGNIAHWVGFGPKSDWAGRAILERYLTAGGDWHIRGDRKWKDYMFANEFLQAQVLEQLRWEVLPKLQKGVGAYLFHKRFQAGTGESSATPSGYGYLNGTNWDVGGFELSGVYRIFNAPDGGFVVTALLEFDWHDKIDPNGLQDAAGDALALVLSEGMKESYALHIHWDSLTKLRFDAGGKLVESHGYPGTMNGVLPGPELSGYPYPEAYQR